MMTTQTIPSALREMLAVREGDTESERLARKQCHDLLIHCWGLRPQAKLVLDLLGQSPETEFEKLVASFQAVGGLQSMGANK